MAVDRYGTVVVEGRGERVDLEEREVFRARGPSGERRLEFLGDAAVAAAVRQVLRDRSPVIYVLSGHGEPTLFSRGVGELRELPRLFDTQGWVWRSLDLLRDTDDDAIPEIPSDATALLILTPRVPLAVAEQEAVTRYLGAGGALAVFVEPGTEGLGFLEELGVGFPEGIALDVVNYLPHRDRPLLHYGPHPITEELAVANVTSVAAYAGPVDVAPMQGVQAAELLRTSRRGWVERGEEIPPEFTAEEDQPGPVVLATALRITAPHPWIGDSGEARVVVVGDLDLARDELLAEAPGNATFVANTMRWLMRLDERFTRVGRVARPQRLRMSDDHLRSVQWLVVGIAPLSTLLIGLLVWAWRRLR